MGYMKFPPLNITICFIDAWNILLWRQFFFGDRREIGEFSEFPTVPDSPKFLGCRPRTTFTGGSARARERRAPSATRVAFLTRRTQKKKTETTSNLLFFYLSPVIVDTTAAPALYVVAQ